MRLYQRFPLLFFVLAAVVIVPYELIVLALTGGGVGRGEGSGFGVVLLGFADPFLVTPLVSALHVHAVAVVRDGGSPRLAPVALQGLKVLPAVAAVSIISWLGITLGLIALIVPGIFLMLRWFVVAQAAAIEQEGWLPALRRGAELTDHRYGHVFVFSIYVVLITFVPGLLGLVVFGDDLNAVSFLVGLVVMVLTTSFAALTTALLYYDLRLRGELAPAVAASDSGMPPKSPS